MNQPSQPPAGLGWILDASQQPLHPQMRPLIQGAIIELAEQLSRFIVWHDTDFVGFRQSKEEALKLAHEQPSGSAVYIYNTESTSGDRQNAFCVVAGVIGKVGPLPSQIRDIGFRYAEQMLAKNIADKRNIMVETQDLLRKKYKGNMPPMDSPPHPDRELWDQVSRDFENAKIWHQRFFKRHMS